MYATKKIGPRKEPYGMPDEIRIIPELMPLATTDGCLLSKNVLIHFKVSFLIL